MKTQGCLTATEILNANGRVINNPDGTISVFTISPITGMLAPMHLTKPCCEKLGIAGAYFDVNEQECRWAASGTTDGCDYSRPFNLVLNPKGNDGAIFSITPDEFCELEVQFDYLFKFDCTTLANLIRKTITGDCKTTIDVFESISAAMTIDVVDIIQGNTVLTQVYEETFFPKIGKNNLYNYLKAKSADTGFYVCNKTGDTATNCESIELYDVTTGPKTSCVIFENQILDLLFKESGLPDNDTTTFKKYISNEAFASNWLHFTTTINDLTILSAITNEKIKLVVKLSGSCINECLLLDNIQLNKKCTKILRNDIFLSKSPSFELDKIIDNKKSWITNTERTHREFNILKSDGTQPIRNTDYYLNDERQVINTKELDLDINIASAIETDVWCYLSDNDCILSALTGCVVYTSMTTSYSIVTTGTTTGYTCAIGYSATPANDCCKIIETVFPLGYVSGGTISAGSPSIDYGISGTYFYNNIRNLDNSAFPVFYSGGSLMNQTGGTITPTIITTGSTFWASSGSTSNGRLNNAGINGNGTGLTDNYGFTYSISAATGGTYYLGIGSNSNASLIKINSEPLLFFVSSGLTSVEYNRWTVFEVDLCSGLNLIETRYYGSGASIDFGFEIYKPDSFLALTGATTSGITEANVIASTKDKVGGLFDIGSTVGYTCLNNRILNPNDTKCYSILQSNLLPSGTTTATTATTTTTSSGETTSTTLCCDPSYVGTVISTASGSGTTFSSITATTGCCSGSCGDIGVDINNMLTQPLSAITTIEDFEYYITSELIDAKNRKILSAYPTLRLLYDRYMNSTNHCTTESSRFDYSTMNQFAGLIGNYWVDIIEQVIPATTIWGSTKIYTNTIFDKQKYKYKGYSTFFGDNTFTTSVLSPASGSSINASATTMVIQGSSTGTTMFLNEGDEHQYSNLYLVQMNSGSEFLGSINIVGPSGGNNVINEPF